MCPPLPILPSQGGGLGAGAVTFRALHDQRHDDQGEPQPAAWEWAQFDCGLCTHTHTRTRTRTRTRTHTHTHIHTHTHSSTSPTRQLQVSLAWRMWAWLPLPWKTRLSPSSEDSVTSWTSTDQSMSWRHPPGHSHRHRPISCIHTVHTL